MKFVRIAFVLCTLLVSNEILAQYEIGVQIRPRGEYRNGFKTLTNDDRSAAFFIEQRSRLWARYNTDKFEVKINFQDVRIWGSTNQIYKTDPTLTNTYEAWGRYKFNSVWSLKIGRMDLNYDNARFLGNLDWAAQGRSHDAAVVTYKNDSTGVQLDFGAAYNQNGFEPAKLSDTFYALNNYKAMQYLWFKKNWGASALSFLIQNDGRQVRADSTSAYRQTYGIIGSGKLGSVKLNGELYYQGGKNATDTDISALLASLSATFNTSVTPLTIGFDYLSGTSIRDGKDKSFSPLYGTNHKFYGFMDYFYVGNFHGQQGRVAGLMDWKLMSKFKMGPKASLVANTHIFSSAADLYDLQDTNVSISKYLGTEIDLVFNYTLDKQVNMNIGYSQMFASSSMEQVKTAPGDHGNLNNWFWFMINFNPIVYNSADN